MDAVAHSSLLAAVGEGGCLPTLSPTCRIEESYFLCKSYTSFDTFDSGSSLGDDRYDAILPEAL